MAVGGVELAEIAGDALLELGPTPLHLRARKVPITVVHRLELAAVNGDARLRQQTHLAAEFDEASAHLADGTAVVLPEIGDRLVIGRRPSSHIISTLRPASRSSRRLDCTRLRYP